MGLIKLIIGFVLGFGIVVLFAFISEGVKPMTLNGKVDNYPIDKVDTSKMISDKVMNKLSDKQVQRNMVNGKYDKR